MTTTRSVAIIIATVAAAVAFWLLIPAKVSSGVPNPEVIAEKPQPTAAELDLIHRQETWISALEWCESRGKNSALNAVDRDGTSSYSNFQWKPGTLVGFAIKYELVPATTTVADFHTLLKDYELQRETVRRMINDKEVNIYNQFPDCIKIKIGPPPLK